MPSSLPLQTGGAGRNVNPEEGIGGYETRLVLDRCGVDLGRAFRLRPATDRPERRRSLHARLLPECQLLAALQRVRRIVPRRLRTRRPGDAAPGAADRSRDLSVLHAPRAARFPRADSNAHRSLRRLRRLGHLQRLPRPANRLQSGVQAALLGRPFAPRISPDSSRSCR